MSVPEDMHKEMKKFSEVKWSEVARKAFTEKLEALHLAEELANKSKLTAKDIAEFSQKMKAAATRRFLSEGNNRL